MPDDQRRVVVLCEDRLAERFLLQLCQRHGIKVIDIDVAPMGVGAASAYVRRRYVEHVRKRRSKNFQKNLGLLVHVDGDNIGLLGRKRELDEELSTKGLPRRASEEPVAVFVPTWSIETWLAHLSGSGNPTEDVPLKPRPPDSYRQLSDLWNSGAAAAATISVAVGFWELIANPPPSLADAQVEGRRVGLP